MLERLNVEIETIEGCRVMSDTLRDIADLLEKGYDSTVDEITGRKPTEFEFHIYKIRTREG